MEMSAMEIRQGKQLLEKDKIITEQKAEIDKLKKELSKREYVKCSKCNSDKHIGDNDCNCVDLLARDLREKLKKAEAIPQQILDDVEKEIEIWQGYDKSSDVFTDRIIEIINKYIGGAGDGSDKGLQKNT